MQISIVNADLQLCINQALNKSIREGWW
jgi:hypothetical protein